MCDTLDSGTYANERVAERRVSVLCSQHVQTDKNLLYQQGTFVIEYVGELISPEEAAARLMRKNSGLKRDFYLLTVEQNVVIDACDWGM